jgi:hypothetical protein
MAPPNASGTAEMEVGHRSASRSNRIEVETRGLLPGQYTVTVFDRSGGTSAVLGTFAVGDDDDDNDDNDHNRGRGRGKSNGHDNDGEARFAIPESIGALDLGLISVADNSSIEVLTGHFASASNTLKGRVRWGVDAIGGAGAPEASGRAEIKGLVKRGGNGTFRLDAENLPTHTALILNVNGEDVGTVTTDRRGRLRIRRSLKSFDVSSISTISLRDETDAEVLTANF